MRSPSLARGGCSSHGSTITHRGDLSPMLPGLMMDFPLTLTHFLERANTFFPDREIVSRLPDGSLHRYTYRDYYARTCQLAHTLSKLGVEPGDRVATLGWNHFRH